jgi:uncharacterized protein YutE (UPF0331/DUF86 family)
VTPAKLRADIVADRIAWIRQMLAGLRDLPLDSYAVFVDDPRNPAAAESYLRRALEGLLDLGRHVLAKGFGLAVTQYKDIADGLVETGVIDAQRGSQLRETAGYRNRLVHFYDNITLSELYQICAERSADIDAMVDVILAWIRADPARIDRTV